MVHKKFTTISQDGPLIDDIVGDALSATMNGLKQPGRDEIRQIEVASDEFYSHYYHVEFNDLGFVYLNFLCLLYIQVYRYFAIKSCNSNGWIIGATSSSRPRHSTNGRLIIKGIQNVGHYLSGMRGQ